MSDASFSFSAESANPQEEQSAAADKAPQYQELDEVRELLLGPQQRLRQPEADRLREIIFGGDIVEFQRQFGDIRRELERVFNDLRNVQDDVNQFQKSVLKRLENLEREQRQAQDRTQRELDRLRSQEPMLQQLITQTRQQQLAHQALKTTTEDVRKLLIQREQDISGLRSALDENSAQQERKLDSLKLELRHMDDSVRQEVRNLVDRLNHQKTDRKALAAMLLEVATRLETGNTVGGLIDNLSRSAE